MMKWNIKNTATLKNNSSFPQKVTYIMIISVYNPKILKTKAWTEAHMLICTAAQGYAYQEEKYAVMKRKKH